MFFLHEYSTYCKYGELCEHDQQQKCSSLKSAILKQKLTIKTTRNRTITGAHFASRVSTAKTKLKDHIPPNHKE
jgi:hypothetical protein